jgi:hypothetical protein
MRTPLKSHNKGVWSVFRWTRNNSELWYIAILQKRSRLKNSIFWFSLVLQILGLPHVQFYNLEHWKFKVQNCSDLSRLTVPLVILRIKWIKVRLFVKSNNDQHIINKGCKKLKIELIIVYGINLHTCTK